MHAAHSYARGRALTRAVASGLQRLRRILLTRTMHAVISTKRYRMQNYADISTQVHSLDPDLGHTGVRGLLYVLECFLLSHAWFTCVRAYGHDLHVHYARTAHVVICEARSIGNSVNRT